MSEVASPERSRLGRIARRGEQVGAKGPGPEDERCELCAEPLPPDHPHLLDVADREVRCACRACGVLFDRAAAGGGKLRRIPDRRWRLDDLVRDDPAWAAFGIPVDLAFFVTGGSGEVTAYYPGPAGVTKAAIEAEAWGELVRTEPALGGLEPDVEALLVRRRGRSRSHFLVPVDDCFRLVALMRRSWQGFSGGTVLWDELDDFFDELGRRAKVPARPASDMARERRRR